MKSFSSTRSIPLLAKLGFAVCILSACGDDTGGGAATGGAGGSIGGGGGGGGGNSTTSAGSSMTTGGMGTGGAGGMANVVCSAESICLEVAMLPGQAAPTAAGQLGIVWVNPYDIGAFEQWQVAYDTSFGPEATQYAIPKGSIAAPAPTLAYCGPDGCNGPGPRVFIGGVVAARDANNNGALDINGEAAVAEKIGIAFTIIINSTQDHAAAPPELAGLFDGPIRSGTHAYTINGSGPAKLSPGADQQAFVLNACGGGNPTCGSDPQITNPFADLSL